VPGRDLLLAVAELGVVLLEGDALPLERVGEHLDVILRRGHPDRREAEAFVDGPVVAVDPGRERELVLERRLQHRAALCEPRRLPLEERALADRRRLAVERDVIDEDGAARRYVGQDAEGLEVGDEPDLADRPHPFDRLELVERVHRLHPDGEPDPGAQPALEPVPRRGLGADRAVVAAPEEPDEAEACLLDPPHDLVGFHSGLCLVEELLPAL
jgi:hypothetical protein